MSKWIEIFRDGKHIESNGIGHTYTDADIERTAKLYQERKVDDLFYSRIPEGKRPGIWLDC